MRVLTRVVFEIAEEENRAFKAEAFRLGITQVELFRRMWREWQEKNKPEKPKGETDD